MFLHGNHMVGGHDERGSVSFILSALYCRMSGALVVILTIVGRGSALVGLGWVGGKGGRWGLAKPFNLWLCVLKRPWVVSRCR